MCSLTSEIILWNSLKSKVQRVTCQHFQSVNGRLGKEGRVCLNSSYRVGENPGRIRSFEGLHSPFIPPDFVFWCALEFLCNLWNINKSLPCSNNRNNINGNDPGSHRAHPHDLGCLKINLKWSETAYFSDTPKMSWNLDFLHYVRQKNILVKNQEKTHVPSISLAWLPEISATPIQRKRLKYTKVQELSSINQGESW